MTNKQRLMAQAMAEGLSLKEAAERAGYNQPYARRKAKDPAFVALVAKLKARDEPSAEARDVVARCWMIINDPTSDDAQRISAMRTLIAYERAHPTEPERQAPVIIDDIEPKCEKCPYKGRYLTGGNDFGAGKRPEHDGQGDQPGAAGAAEAAGDEGQGDGGDLETAQPFEGLYGDPGLTRAHTLRL